MALLALRDHAGGSGGGVNEQNVKLPSLTPPMNECGVCTAVGWGRDATNALILPFFTPFPPFVQLVRKGKGMKRYYRGLGCDFSPCFGV